MRKITTESLNWFWKKGILPIKEKLNNKIDVANLVNNGLCEMPGEFALDAAYGKTLTDQITQLNSEIQNFSPARLREALKNSGLITDESTYDDIISALTSYFNKLIPTFSYSGNYNVVDEGNGNWKIKFLTSGVLRFLDTNMTMNNGIDIFLVGGGAGGGIYGNAAPGGGGGGYTKTQKGYKNIAVNTDYNIVVGPGGAANKNGGASSAFGFSVAGGLTGGGQTGTVVAPGGSGGSGGGSGGANGGNGGTNGGSGGVGSAVSGYSAAAGSGQSVTTREFGEASGALYGGGGGGAGIGGAGGTGGAGGGGNGARYSGSNLISNSTNGVPNTGGGAGGGNSSGGSGIVIMRNARI